MIVRTFDGLQALTTPASTLSAPSGSLNLYGLSEIYGEIYRTQPNVRICVDFLARNVAQLGLPVYRRISDTDRARLVDHDLARWLANPNPATTRYRLIESLMSDLGIYFNAYWLKVRHDGADGRAAIGLVRLPPEEMRVDGGLLPTTFRWVSNGREKVIAGSEVVYFNGYNPLNALMGLSPMETLRRIMAEECAAGDYRESLWAHGARLEGVIERPPTAPKWTGTQPQDFRDQWQQFASGAKAGMTAVLEDGMTYKSISFSAKDSEYIQGNKLRREVCAAQYHIPQPMIGILDHATFSNIREQHKHTYQDCLGPWNEMITQELERQLLTECDDQRSVYIEFNIDAKLAGTPEERATSLQLAVGRPWRTVNEARALENLPRNDDPESDKVAPQQGGPAGAPAPPARTPPARSSGAGADDDDDDDAENRLVAPVLHAARLRQQARLAKLPSAARAEAFFADLDRWNRELTADLDDCFTQSGRHGACHSRPSGTSAAIASKANVATLTQLIVGEGV